MIDHLAALTDETERAFSEEDRAIAKPSGEHEAVTRSRQSAAPTVSTDIPPGVVT